MNTKVVQPAGNFYDKYNAKNPIAKLLMQGFLDAFGALVSQAGPAGSALEVGCGEGELSMRLNYGGWQVQACDIAEEAIAEACARAAAASLSIPYQVIDIFNAAGAYEKHDLVVCCEVLEHLEDPEAAIRTLIGLSRGYILLSVPREPVWRVLNMVRGSYWAQLGNTPGHIQHWTRRGFLRLLERHVEVVSVRSPLPWTLALCRIYAS